MLRSRSANVNNANNARNVTSTGANNNNNANNANYVAPAFIIGLFAWLERVIKFKMKVYA